MASGTDIELRDIREDEQRPSPTGSLDLELEVTCVVNGRDLSKEVFHSLDDQGARRPAIPAANMLINELIREYLEYFLIFISICFFKCMPWRSTGTAGTEVVTCSKVLISSVISNESVCVT